MKTLLVLLALAVLVAGCSTICGISSSLPGCPTPTPTPTTDGGGA